MGSASGAMIVVSLECNDRNTRLVIALGAGHQRFTSCHTRFLSFRQLLIVAAAKPAQFAAWKLALQARMFASEFEKRYAGYYGISLFRRLLKECARFVGKTD